MGFRCVVALVVGTWLAIASPLAAQGRPDDAAGREYFERGRSAFAQADYESALIYFRHAYRLSRRGELQYNIGVAADRLQREEEALEAFRQYLEETESPTREAEARQRIEALRRSLDEREAAARALQEARGHALEHNNQNDEDGARISRSALFGGSALGAVGAAGVIAMGVGLARSGECAEELGGQCVVERSATAWTWVYGGLGVAALAGSATWFAIGVKRSREKRGTQISVTPTGVMVSGTF